LRLPITGRLPPLGGENPKRDADELNGEGMQNGRAPKQGSDGHWGRLPAFAENENSVIKI
jgi:hypothetical protein